MKNLQKYLSDALDAIVALEKISANLTIQDMEDIYTRWTLERGLAIVGEALYQANKIQENLSITNIKRIMATRHIIVHDYDLVDRIQIYTVLKKHLSLLRSEIENILNNLEN